MSSITVVGSINMDIVTKITRLPKPGETIFGEELHFIPGGKGENQAIAAARLYDDVHMVGKLGRDAFGKELHAFLQGENVNLENLAFSDSSPTGVALITVDENSENTIVVISGSNAELSKEDVDGITLDESSTVVSVLEVPQETIKHIFQKTKNGGGRTILNAAPAASLIPGLLDLTDVLVVNEIELEMLAGPDGSDDIETQARGLRSREDQTLVVTLGAKGAVCLHGSDWITVKGFEVAAVDTTGAGDCFVGSLSVALVEGKGISEALHFANAGAALSVQKLGAATSLPHRAELDAFLASL